MSWYVQHILLDGDTIRSKIVMETGDDSWETDLDDDEYLDLLSVEMKIKQLGDMGIIDKQELEIIDRIKRGNSFRDIERELGLSRPTIYKIFKEACNKISFSLGDYFSDDGYIDYIRHKYSLQEDEVNKTIRVIKGKN